MTGGMTTFRHAILDPKAPIPAGILDGKNQVQRRGFNVHRNNVTVSLTNALEETFPVIRELIGHRIFHETALAFLRQNPPKSPVMMHYGSDLPEFLKVYPLTADIAYLPDIARLELALRESYHEADAATIEPAEVQAYVSKNPTGARLGLSPTVRLAQSAWPIFSIWRFNTVDDAPKPEMTAEDVLIVRSDLDVAPHLLPAGGLNFIKALSTGHSMEAAVNAATNDSEPFDLSETFKILIATQSITSIGT